MEVQNAVKLLREIALIRATKDIDESMKESLIATLKARLREITSQGVLPLGSQVTNLKAK